MQLVLPLFTTLRRFTGSGIRLESGRARLRRALAAREAVSLSPKRKLLVCCRQGLVWITTGDGTGDVLLTEGEQLAVNAGYSAVIEGLEESVVEIAS